MMTTRLMAISLAFAGCVGSVGHDVGGGTGSSDPTATSGGGTAAKPPEVAGCSGTPNPGHVLVHRLNRVEYNNTIRDLLGNQSRPANELPPDVPVAGFDNNSTGLHVDTDLLGQYDGMAERLAQTTVAAPGFISCVPAPVAEEPCARKVLEPFVRRAWRRPVAAAEVDRLLEIVQVARDNQDSFENGLALAIRAVLMSPKFLYRFELPPRQTGAGTYLLDAHSVANRLSYFLWSSMPDDALSAAADSGEILKPARLTAEIARMLSDPKTAALADNLSGQWLSGRAAFSATPSPAKFPLFDPDLRTSIQTETSLFLNAFFQDNLDLRGLLDADFTFLNARLAKHYKITDKNVTGDDFKKVSLVGHPQRGGIITHAAFQVATSKLEQPSIPQRGKWVLNNILCTPPAPPPMDATTEQVKIDMMLGPDATRRQSAEARDARPVCKTCHARLDPIGIALDKYDATGAWRETDGIQPIDVRGSWNGTAFATPRELAHLLRQEDTVPGCVANAIFRYALGRTVTDSDQCLIDDIKNKALDGGFKARDIIGALVMNPVFQYQDE